MAKPYKESGVWSFRLRIQGEDIYRTGFATEALARREADNLRHALKNTGKPRSSRALENVAGRGAH